MILWFFKQDYALLLGYIDAELGVEIHEINAEVDNELFELRRRSAVEQKAIEDGHAEALRRIYLRNARQKADLWARMGIGPREDGIAD